MNAKKPATTYFITETVEPLFMFIKKPIKNSYTQSEEYVVKVKLFEGSKTLEHLKQVAKRKVFTETNMTKNPPGEFHVSFSSIYKPIILDKHGSKLEGDDIPYFDGRKDKAKITVVYTVKEKMINNELRTYVRLYGVKILELEQEEKDIGSPKEIIAEIKEFLEAKGTPPF